MGDVDKEVINVDEKVIDFIDSIVLMNWFIGKNISIEVVVEKRQVFSLMLELVVYFLNNVVYVKILV